MMLYSLIKNNETNEVHIFKSEMRSGECYCLESHSICERMIYSKKNITVLGSCLDEDAARLKCAKIGRKVCGTCVSHLYATYDD